MRIKMKRFLGILLSLALVLGMMPGMSLTARADTQSTYKIEVTDLSYNDTRTLVTDAVLPYTTTAQAILNLQDWIPPATDAELESGSNVTVSGTNITVTGVGSSQIKIKVQNGGDGSFSIIIFEKESVNTLEASGELMVTILASIAQQESASISQNVRMGINFGFQEGRGRVNFSSFLGYRRGDKPGTYEIVPAEADVVRRIYRQFLEGYSPKMIADGLMENGICTPSGGEKWYPSTVASILENEKYAGDLLMQKWYVEDYLTHKCVKNSGEKPQYFVEDDHDPHCAESRVLPGAGRAEEAERSGKGPEQAPVRKQAGAERQAHLRQMRQDAEAVCETG